MCNMVTMVCNMSLTFVGVSQVMLVVQKHPACAGCIRDMGESLGQEDLLEEGMATHSSVCSWRISMDRGSWQAIVHGVTKSWI